MAFFGLLLTVQFVSWQGHNATQEYWTYNCASSEKAGYLKDLLS